MDSKPTVQLLLLLHLTALSLGQTGNPDLRCYVCELEGTDACEDPFDSSQVASAVCSSLEYKNRVRARDDEVPNPDELNIVDHKFRGSPVLNKVFHRNETERKPFKYVCIKVELEKDDNRAIMRSCQRAWNDVDDVCDYISQELNSNIKVTNCNYCEIDNCNGGGFFSASLILVFVGVFYTITSGL